MPKYIQPIAGLRTDQALAAALATPATVADGIDITKWRTAATPQAYPMAAVAISADGAGTLDTASLYGFGPYGIGGAAQWFFVSLLNNGTQIALSTTKGFIQQINMPCVFTRLAVGGTVGGGINVSYTATPLAEAS